MSRSRPGIHAEENRMRVLKFCVCTLAIVLALAAVGTWLAQPTRAQGGASGDWPSHNIDIRNSRYSPLDQINTSNAGRLKEQWSIQASGSDIITQTTPLVVGGVMYYNAGSKMFAVDAATGK